MIASELAPNFVLFTVFAFALGCCIGSFMNVVVWRLPRGENLSWPPSRCPKCGHQIRPWENIPIISWLCLRARCSSCHLPISVKYPLGEAATGLLFTAVWIAIYTRHLPLAVLPAYFYLVASLLAAALIDAEHRFIPDKVNFPGMIFAFVFSLVLPSSRSFAWNMGDYAQGNMLLAGFCRLTGLEGMDPRIMAGIDCLLGAAFGFAVIYLFSLALSPFVGGRKIYLREHKGIRISGQGIEMDGTLNKWDELASGGMITVHGTLKGDRNIVKITADAEGYSVDGEWHEHGQSPFKVTAHRISASADAVGFGDVKFMAMIGAFLGADASIYILFAAAVIGLAWSLIVSLFKRRFYKSMPFGPPIAVAALAWVLFGNVFL